MTDSHRSSRPHLLTGDPDVPADLARKVSEDHDRFARSGLPENLEAYLVSTYGLEMSGSYAGTSLRNPWGKASGQLSLNLAQVEEAVGEGLGFVVLKTVIAQDAAGRAGDGRLGHQGIADGRRADHQPANRGAGLDDHLAGQGMVAIVRRLPQARP